MTSPAAITFALPYYSNLGYLREAIDSVLAQTISNWKMIVVDDAGPESAADLVHQLDDHRISYIRNSVNLGLAGNWNECLRHATTSYVTLLHTDDRLSPRYAAAVLAAAEAHPEAAAVFTDAAIIGADGLPARSLPDFVKRFARRPRADHEVVGDTGLAGVLTNNYIFCPALTYRTSSIGSTPFDPRWSMVLDLDLIARLLAGGQSLRCVRQPLYEYRRHQSNQTALLTADARRFTEEIALYRELAAIAATQKWTRSEKAAQWHVMVRIHLVVQIVNDAIRGRRQAASSKWAMLKADLRRE